MIDENMKIETENKIDEKTNTQINTNKAKAIKKLGQKIILNESIIEKDKIKIVTEMKNINQKEHIKILIEIDHIMSDNLIDLKT